MLRQTLLAGAIAGLTLTAPLAAQRQLIQLPSQHSARLGGGCAVRLVICEPLERRR